MFDFISFINNFVLLLIKLLIQILSYVVNQISKSNISKVRYNLFRTWTLPFRFKLLLTKSSSMPAALPVWPPIHSISSLLTKSSVSLSNSLFYFRSTKKVPRPRTFSEASVESNDSFYASKIWFVSRPFPDFYPIFIFSQDWNISIYKLSPLTDSNDFTRKIKICDDLRPGTGMN